jgi:hypothetical protein
MDMLHYVSVYLHARVEKLRDTEDFETAADILSKLCLLIGATEPDLAAIKDRVRALEEITEINPLLSTVDVNKHRGVQRPQKRIETRGSNPFMNAHSSSLDTECHQSERTDLTYEGHNGFRVCCGLYSLAPLGLFVLVSVPGMKWERCVKHHYGSLDGFTRISKLVALYSWLPP